MTEKNIITNNIPFLKEGIYISFLIHIVIMSVFLMKKEYKTGTQNFEIQYVSLNQIFENKKQNQATNSNLILKEKPLKKQIVDESDKVNNVAPKNTNLLAEHDNTVKKEQIKRGNPELKKDIIIKGDGKPKTDAKIDANPKNITSNLNSNLRGNTNNKPSGATNGKNGFGKKQAPPKNLELSLNMKTLFSDFKDDENENSLEGGGGLGGLQRTYKPFSRRRGSGASFISKSGSATYLPNLPDGDITLLNTKAEYFAVFVRRVALSVFGKLKQSGWEMLSRADINMIQGFSEFEAIMDLNGNITQVKQNVSSKSFQFDEILRTSILKASKDSNPPSNAKAEDGLIHFIFQAKCWSKNDLEPNGMFGERRWLLLQTGLK